MDLLTRGGVGPHSYNDTEEREVLLDCQVMKQALIGA
jgi:hypothetical protein